MGSSVDQFLQQTGGRSATPAQASDSPSDVDKFLGVDPEVQARLGVGVTTNKDTQPDIAARILRLQSKTGLPEDLIARNLDSVEKDARVADFDPAKYSKSSPIVARWLAEHPQHMALASQDLTRLNYWERQWGNIKAQFHEGQNVTELQSIGEAAMRGDVTPEQRRRQADIEAKQSNPQADYGLTGFFEGIPGAIANQLPIMKSTVFAQGKAAVAAGAAGLEAGLIGGVITGGVAGAAAGAPTGPGEVAAIPFGMATGGTAGATIGARTGFAAGWKYGGIVQAGRMEGALAYLEFEKIRDKDGHPLDRKTMLGAAAITGALNGMLEMVGLESIQKAIPGWRNFTREGIRRSLVAPTMRAAMLKVAKHVGESMATEGSTEFLQDIVKNGSGELATMIHDGSINTKTMPEILSQIFSPEHMQEAISDAKAGAQAGLGMAAGGQTFSFINEYKDIKQAQERQAFFTALGTNMQGSEMLKNMPDKMQEAVSRLTKDGPVENVYMPVQDWKEYWQKQGEDPAKVAEEVTGDPHAFDEAERTGADITIRTARWAVTIAPSEHNAFFAKLLRLAPDEMNYKEAMEMKDQLDKMDQEQQAEAKPGEEGAAAVHEQIAEQLRGLGRFTEPQITQMAKLYGDMTRVIGERTGMTPQAVLERYGVKIEGLDAPEDQGGLQQQDDYESMRTERSKEIQSLVDHWEGQRNQAANQAEMLKQMVDGESETPDDLLNAHDVADNNVYVLKQIQDAVERNDVGRFLELMKGIEDPTNHNTSPELLQQLRTASPGLLATARRPLLPGFQSKLERLIKEKVPKQTTVAQARASISGAKQEERTWTGVDTFLNLRTDDSTITQQELLDYVQKHRVHLELESLGSKNPMPFGEVTEEMENLQNSILEDLVNANARVMMSQHPEMSLREAVERVKRGPVYDELLDQSFDEALAQSQRPAAEMRFWYKDYALPGGENYREVGLRMPELNYEDPHFERQGLVMHMRMTDRTDLQNRKMLFVEEIQSDLHQAARKEEALRKNPPTPEQIERAKFLRDKQARSRLDEAERTEMNKLVEDDVFARMYAMDENKTSYQQRIPNAPFRKTYSELAIKALVVEAVKNGQTMIGWTTGRDQAARYGNGLSQKQRDGLAGYYDEMLPTIVGKFAKAFGGTVATTKIDLINAENYETDVPKVQTMTVPRELNAEEQRQLDHLLSKKAEYEAATSTLQRRMDAVQQELGRLTSQQSPDERRIDELTHEMTQISEQWNAFDHLFSPDDAHDIYTLQNQKLSEQAYPNIHWETNGVPSIITEIHAMEITPAMIRAVKHEEFELYQRAFHGTPHNVDRFSVSKIGTGEGHQSYGWGLYFTGSRDIGQHYKDVLTARRGPQLGGLTAEQNNAIPTEVRQKVAGARDIHHAFDILTKRWEYTSQESVRLSNAQQDLKLQNNFFNGKDQLVRMENETEAIEAFFNHMVWDEDAEGNTTYSEHAEFWQPATKGKLITAEIPERSNMFLWDAKLVDQKQLVKALERMGFIGPDSEWMEFLETGADAYQHITEEIEMMGKSEFERGMVPTKILNQVFPTIPAGEDRTTYILQNIERKAPEIISRWLNDEGFEGIAYLNGKARMEMNPHTAAPQHFNYVVFNDESVSILSQEQRQGGEPHRELRLKATHEVRQLISRMDPNEMDQESMDMLKQVEKGVSSRDPDMVVGAFLSMDPGMQSAFMNDPRAKNLREWLSTFGHNLNDWAAEQKDATDAKKNQAELKQLQEAAYQEAYDTIKNFVEAHGQSLDDLGDPDVDQLNEFLDHIAHGNVAEVYKLMGEDLPADIHEELMGLPNLETWMDRAEGARQGEDMQSHSADPSGEARYEKIKSYALFQLNKLWEQSTDRLSHEDLLGIQELMRGIEDGQDLGELEMKLQELTPGAREEVQALEGWNGMATNNQAIFFGERLQAEMQNVSQVDWTKDEREAWEQLKDAINRGDAGFAEEIVHELLNDHEEQINNLPSFADWMGAASEDQNNEDDNEEDSGNDGPQGWEPPDPEAWMKQNVPEGTPKGRIKIGENEIRIQLFKAADMSTFLHETGHFFLEVLDDLGSQHEELRADRETVRQWLGLSNDEPLTTESHETFARAFEAYLMKGQAPSSALRLAFARMRAWLLGVYKSIKALNVETSPAVERVFDRMLATDTELMAAESEVHATPMFTDPTAVGMTEQQAADYARAIEEAHLTASSELSAKMMNEIAREQTAQFKLRRAEVRRSVVEEVNNDPTWRARALLTRGTLPDGSELPVNLEAFKLSKTALVAYYGQDILAKLPRPHLYSVVGGLHPDIAADILGFKSGDELVQALTETREAPKKYIERLTDERTRQELNNEGPHETTEQQAMDAVHNDKRAQLLQKELQHLASTNIAALKGLIRRVARPLPTLAEVRTQAEDQINSKLVRDIRPIVYQRAEATAGRLAMESLLKGDINGAFDQKQRQLLNAELYRAANNAQEKVQGVVEYMAKFNRLNVRDRLAKAGGDYYAQIEAIRARFDFAKGVSLKDLSNRASLRDFVESQHALGFTISVPDKVLNEAYTQHYKDMTLDELTGVHESVQQIEHLARVKNRLLASVRSRNLEQAVGSIVASIGANHTVKPEPVDFNPSFGKRLKTQARGIIAAHTKMEFLFEWLDGNKEQGPAWKQLFKPMIDAENAEAVMMRNSVNTMRDIFNTYTREERAKWFYNKVHIEGINSSFTKANILAVALNQGNAYNKDALMRGYGWSEQQVQQILSHMDGRDWQVVQKVWDHLESYWPQIAKLEKELNGLAPEKVEATPVDTPHGTFNGGYYPIVFDSKLSWRQATLESKNSVPELFGGQWARAMTKHGHTEARTNTGGKPLVLELSGLSEHISNVIHDLSHRRAVIDVNRITQKADFRTAVEGSVGKEMYKQLHPWLLNIAGARQAGYINPIEGILGRARSGATTVAMGWKMTTALAQVFSYTNSVKEIGTQYALSGLAQVYAKPWEFKNQWSFVTARSEFMKDRMGNYDRDVRDSFKKLNVSGGSSGPLAGVSMYMTPVRESFFTLIGLMDMGASMPTWMGAYSKVMDGQVPELAKGDEQAAIDYADKVVRQTQGVGAPKDMAHVQTGSELYKNFTMFYSYFNVLFNQFAKTKHEYQLTKNVPRLIASLAMLWFVPAVMQELIVGRGPGADDEPSDWLKWLAAKEAAYPFQTVVLLRDIVNGMDKFGYEPSSAFDLFKSLSATGKAAIDVGLNDKDFTRADAKAAADLAGYSLKLPTRQMWLTGEYFYDWMHGNTSPTGPLEAGWRSLISGKPRETQ